MNIRDYGTEDYFNLTIDGAVVTATLTADLKVNGDLAFLNGGTLNLSGFTLTVDGDVSGTGTLNVADGILIVNGDLTVSTLTATSGTVQLGGDFNTAFTANTSTVEFIDPAKPSLISGSNTFNNLNITTPSKTVLFDNTATQTVNSLTVTGTIGNEVQLLSDSDTIAWDISATSSAVHYAYVKDSIAAANIDAINSTDGTGNTNWTFNPPGILDNFEISTITEQSAGQPFSITITAKDSIGATVAGFTGTVTLSDSTATITPTTSPVFVGGVLTLDVTIANPDTGVVITVTDGSVAGQSNSFDVVEYTPFVGLVGNWSFEEGRGTSTGDLSGQGNDGTLVNAPSWTTGISGGALGFNGTTQYVTVPDANSLDFGTSDFSIAGWIKMDTLVNGNYTIF